MLRPCFSTKLAQEAINRLRFVCATFSAARTMSVSTAAVTVGSADRTSAESAEKSAAKSTSVMRVRILEGEPKMKLSFKYSSHLIKDREFNFERAQEETLGSVLARISFSVGNKIGKKLQKMKQKASKKAKNSTANEQPSFQKSIEKLQEDKAEVSEEVKATLICNGKPIPDDVLARDAFSDGAQLCVDGVSFVVRVNTPSVRGAALPKTLMAGFPVAPRLTLEFCTSKEIRLTWWRMVDDGKLELLGESESYTPTVADIGARLKVVCVPVSEDGANSFEVLSTSVIEGGPGECPFDRRHAFTVDRTPQGKFRVVCYNILADLYADSDYSRASLFPTCPPYALAIDYRQQLICKEISGYNADIVCLQEVDTKVFEGDLSMALANCGLQGILGLKGGKVAEGAACFYRAERFSLVSEQTIVLMEVLDKEPALADLYEAVSVNEQLKTKLMARTTSVQIVILRCVDEPQRKLCVANTHLYFHPDADNIRLLQAACCVRLVEQVVALETAKDPECSIAVVICGDFNSTPDTGVYQLMTTQCVPGDHEAWKSVAEETVAGITLSQPFPLVSACGTPLYTNYTTGFQGCLDYIFADDDHLAVQEVVPMPSHEEVTQFGALPSVTVPSDHLALICTLAWKK